MTEGRKNISPNDFADGILALTEFVKQAGRSQRSLIGSLLVVLNDVFDLHREGLSGPASI